MEYDDDTAVRGVLSDMVRSDIVKEMAEGGFGGNIMVNGIGYILYAVMGAVSSAVATTGAYNHTFTIAQTSNSHKSLTVTHKTPNDDNRYTLAMVESFEVVVENNKRVTFNVSLKSKKKASATSTISYTTDYALLAKHSTFKVASNKA